MRLKINGGKNEENYFSVKPASTYITCPVIASFLARKIKASAIPSFDCLYLSRAVFHPRRKSGLCEQDGRANR
ncbi:MAG: hypothetical protein NTZ80_01520 [Patescibacteria group bacterium]|nr:hypothetical protein [Patescibacteria group bacterium]